MKRDVFFLLLLGAYVPRNHAAYYNGLGNNGIENESSGPPACSHNSRALTPTLLLSSCFTSTETVTDEGRMEQGMRAQAHLPVVHSSQALTLTLLLSSCSTSTVTVCVLRTGEEWDREGELRPTFLLFTAPKL